MFAVILVVALQRISIKQPLKPGDQAPVLTLKKLSAGAVSLADLYHEPLAVLFFSANCPHCKTELRNIERLRNAFNGIVQFLLVSRSDEAATGALMDSLGMVIPVAIDEVGRACEKFGVFKVPALFLIDKNGIIQLTSFGEHSLDVRKEQLESFLQALATEAIKPVDLKR
jgi:peroxiredoxin